MGPIQGRLRAAVSHDAINGDIAERAICAQQMLEAAATIDRLEIETRRLSAALKEARDHAE